MSIEGGADLPEVPLPAGSLLVGDPHLDAAGDEVPGAFLRWLAGLRGVPRLIVLGDLFDAWAGPALMRLPAAAAVVDGICRAVEGGTAVDVVPGNRDFLLGRGFEERSRARLLPGGAVGLLDGEGEAGRVLLVHGDELCTRDRGYLRLRRVLRSRPAGWLAPRIPAPLALWTARRLRRASDRALAVKPSEEKSMQAAAARDLLARHACATLVCGHAHEYRDEPLGGGRRWLVVQALGGGRGDVLEVGAEGIRALPNP